MPSGARAIDSRMSSSAACTTRHSAAVAGPESSGKEARGNNHLPKVNPQPSGGKESSYFSVLDRL